MRHEAGIILNVSLRLILGVSNLKTGMNISNRKGLWSAEMRPHSPLTSNVGRVRCALRGGYLEGIQYVLKISPATNYTVCNALGWLSRSCMSDLEYTRNMMFVFQIRLSLHNPLNLSD